MVVKELKFVEETHTYSVGDKVLTSVTTFIHKFFPEFNLKMMSRLVAKRRREKGELNKNGKPLNARDVKKEWALKGDIARSAGTLTHLEIEEFIKGNYSEIEFPVLTPKAQQGIKWFMKSPYAKSKVVTEERIFDEELGLAGTIDVSVYKDKEVTLIDWKTNKAIKKRGYGKGSCGLPNANYYHYTLQLSVYAYMLERQGYIIKDLILAHLKDDGVSVYEIEYRKDVVEGMFENE